MEYISFTDLFLIGPGPSSGYTLAALRAASGFRGLIREFLHDISAPKPEWGGLASSDAPSVDGGEYYIRVLLLGTMSARQHEYLMYEAVCSGLYGREFSSPQFILNSVVEDENCIETMRNDARTLEQRGVIPDPGVGVEVKFDPPRAIINGGRISVTGFNRGLEFQLFTRSEESGERLILSRRWYSIGGGMLCDDSSALLRFIATPEPERQFPPPGDRLSFSFDPRALIGLCREYNTDIAGLIMEQETSIHGELRLRKILESYSRHFFRLMSKMNNRLQEQDTITPGDSLSRISYLLNYISELNTRGEQGIHFAGTGAWGIVAIVYFLSYGTEEDRSYGMAKDRSYGKAGTGESGVLRAVKDRFANYLYTAAAIARMLGKGSPEGVNGCQGETGAAGAMAAAGLTSLRGGTPLEVLSSAAAFLEHFMGLGCPVQGGSIFEPCLSRSAVAAASALTVGKNAPFRMQAVQGNGSAIRDSHIDSQPDRDGNPLRETPYYTLEHICDIVIEYRRRGEELRRSFKQPGTGGFPIEVSIPEC